MIRCSRFLSFALALLCAAPAEGQTFQVTVRDAATASTLNFGLTCALYDESNAVVATSTNNCNLVVPYCAGTTCPKVFRLSVSKVGYYPTSKSGLQLSNTAVAVQLSSKLALSASTEQLRVVLSWGNAHSDLDSYMIVPPATSGGNSCQVNYNNQNCGGVADLDVDDTSYYGPETTTLTNPHAGTYSYLVHIYGAAGKCWDTSGIKARVEVWGSKSGGLIKAVPQPLENKMPRCANVDPDPETCHPFWHVFDLDATTNKFTWVNKMVPDVAAAAAARSAEGSMATYLPSNTATCSCSIYSSAAIAASGTSSWASTTAGIAATLATALLGDDGVAGKATCHQQLQNYFIAAATVDSSKSWADAATDAVDSLATKVSARFDARKSIAISMRDRAKAIYDGSHAGAPENNVGPMCDDLCPDACVFDASFKTSVNRESFGLRFGAKASAAGTSARIADEKVVRGLGVMAKGTFVEHPTTKFVRSACRVVCRLPHTIHPNHMIHSPMPPLLSASVRSFRGADGSTWAPKRGSTSSRPSGRAPRAAAAPTTPGCGRGMQRR